MMTRKFFRFFVEIGLLVFAMLSAHAGMPIFDHRYELLPVGNEVHDLKTELIWQRCLVGQEWNGARCTGSPHKLTFTQAQKLEADGWRLPNKLELETILDNSGIKPTIHRRAFFGVGGDVWTSSTSGGVSHQAWAVSFDYGLAYSALRSNSFYVRLTRN